jgi:phospholipid/cholesterol/gamma-HCH transport system substrate-binding protein
MEIKARYVLIGLFVLAVIVGGFGFVYWLNNSGGLNQRTAYRIEFDGSISGLWVGSDVLFNGLTVGEVTSLDLVPENPGQVVATIAVDSRTPVRADTRIGLVFGGLTGTAAVALAGGSPTAPPLTSANGEPPTLHADSSAAKDLTQAARDTLARIDKLVADNSAAVTDVITNINTFTAALGRNSGKVDGILQGLEKLTGGGKVEPQAIYDLTPPAAFPAIATLPSAQLGILTPVAVISLDTRRILVQTADGESPAFPEVQWADNIPALVQARLVQSFENAKYLKVGADGGDLTADFKLAVDIRRFRVATSPEPARADVEFSAKVLDQDGKVVDARVFSATAPVSATDKSAVAADAIDTAFGTSVTELVTWTLEAMNKSSADIAEPEADPAPAP